MLVGPGLAGGAPGLAADFVEGAGGPGDGIKRVGAQDRYQLTVCIAQKSEASEADVTYR